MLRGLLQLVLVTLTAVLVAVLAILALIWAGVTPSAAAPIAGGVVTAVASAMSLRKEFGFGSGDRKMPFLHHVSLPVRDLRRSEEFYRNAMGLRQIPRANLTFGVDGAWFELPDGQQLHLLVSPSSTFRSDADAQRDVWNDCHFALRVQDLNALFKRLDSRKAFLTTHAHVSARNYPHFYTLDPDNHVIEVNAKLMKEAAAEESS